MHILRNLLIGSPLPTGDTKETRLSKVQALAAFSPDALSSIAYANQEIFLALVAAGSAGLSMSFPIGVAITALLVLVALSYYQTIQAYPSGGGSYIVARTNLGKTAGLTAASALLVGYTLTAAVSLTAGVAAIASSFPILWNYQTELALFFLGVITLINLRGARETGTLMGFPVYFFLASFLGMLVFGFITSFITRSTLPGTALLSPTRPLTAIITLQAFAAGCTALTGIEAISNGVPAFKTPEVKNAGKTLLVMALLMAILFIGSIGLTQYLRIIPQGQETILSALARRILGSNMLYVIVQVSSMLILVVAANTSYSGFPRLAAILARDQFLPNQFIQLGDRLVYSNGIFLLASATALLIILFGGDSHALVPLFAVGVFLAFTLSQAGMVIHWQRAKGHHWPLKLAINAFGAAATGVATLIIAISRFTEGAWISLLVIPLLVLGFLRIEDHYKTTARQIALKGNAKSAVRSAATSSDMRVIVPVSGVHRGVAEALQVAYLLTSRVKAAYVEIDPDQTEALVRQWAKKLDGVPLEVIPSPYRSLISPLLDFLDFEDASNRDGQLAAVLLPDLVPAKWWHYLLHNNSARLIKNALLHRRRHQGYQRVIIDVPFHLSD